MNDRTLLVLGAALLLLAILFYWQAGRAHRSTGLPGGEVIYADPATWKPTEQPLYDAQLGLAGKPDYLVRQGEQIIPVEVKSSRTPDSPYDAHIYQLAAYCLLVERTYGSRPRYGFIHYPKRTFRVEYTAQLESALLDVLAEIRTCERQAEVARSHEQPARCDRCGYRNTCDERL